jgi:hypothetical protein
MIGALIVWRNLQETSEISPKCHFCCVKIEMKNFGSKKQPKFEEIKTMKIGRKN